MGKSKKKLLIARKDISDELKKQYTREDDYLEEEEEEEEEIDTKIDLGFELRTALIDYSFDNAISMCEYLDQENVVNFLDWILKKR